MGRFILGLLGAASLAALVASVFFRVKLPTKRWEHLAVWRWFLFFAILVPLYYLPNYLMLLMVAMVESKLLNAGPHLIYYIMGVRAPTIRLLRILSWMLLFVLVFRHSRLYSQYHEVYTLLVKGWICICLFFLADVLAALVAKAMSRHFHSISTFLRMQAAVRKEYFLVALSKPRPMDTTMELAAEMQTLMENELAKVERSAGSIRTSRGSMDVVHERAFRGSLDAVHVAERGTRGSLDVGRAPGGHPPHRTSHLDPHSTPSQLPSPLASSRLLEQLTERKHSESSQAVLVGAVKGVIEKVSDFNRRMRDLQESVKGKSSSHGQSAKPKRISREVLQGCLYRLERHIRKNKLQVTLTQQLGDAAAMDEITNKAEAKKMALFLFWHILPPGLHFNRSYIVQSDLHPFLEPSEAKVAFTILDENGDGHVSMKELQQAVLKIYQERKNLAHALKDTKSVVGKLQLICQIVFHVLGFFSYLVVFQINVKELWISISSVTLAFVFVFGNSIRNIYEGVIFLFVVHAFDVGDYLLINDSYHKVEEIALMTTTMVRSDGRRVVFPNVKLTNEPIVNVSRSETLWDSVQLLVDADTHITGVVIDGLGNKLRDFLAQHPAELSGKGGINVGSIEGPMKLRLSAFWEYTHNAEDVGRKNKARTKILLLVAQILKEAGLEYTIPRQLQSFRNSGEGIQAGMFDPTMQPALASMQ